MVRLSIIQWNWQRRDWPNLTYDSATLEPLEHEFLHGTGLLFGAYGSLEGEERNILKVQIISDEAHAMSRIEEEHLAGVYCEKGRTSI